MVMNERANTAYSGRGAYDECALAVSACDKTPSAEFRLGSFVAMGLPESPAGVTLLTESESQSPNGLSRHEVTHNTIRCYRSQWRSFVTWAAARRIPAVPRPIRARSPPTWPERFEQHGHKPATLRVAAAAIAYVHSSCGPLPTRATTKTSSEPSGEQPGWPARRQKQAKGLTADALDAIESHRLPATPRQERQTRERTGRRQARSQRRHRSP